MKSKVIVFGLALLLLNIGYSLAEESTRAKSSETTTQKKVAGDQTTVKFCLICGPEEKTESLPVSYKYNGIECKNRENKNDSIIKLKKRTKTGKSN